MAHHKKKKENINLHKANEALQHLKSGYTPFLTGVLEYQHSCFILDIKRTMNITYSAEFAKCSCSLETLQPAHAHVYGKCPFDQGRKCFCVDTKRRQPCAAGFCGKMHDKILTQHRSFSPNFRNTNIEQWRSDPLQIGLANIRSKVHTNIRSLSDVDPIRMLQILVNDMEVTFDTKMLELFKKIKQSRDEFTHSADMAVEDCKLLLFLDTIVQALDMIPRCDETDEAKSHVLKLKDEVWEVTTKTSSKDYQSVTEKDICCPQVEKESEDQEKNQYHLSASATLEATKAIGIYQNVKHSHELRLSSMEQKIAFKKYLMKKYQKDALFIENGISVDEVFVPQRMLITHENEKIAPRQMMNFKEMFYHGDSRVKNVYIIGKVGMGKTVLLKYLTSTWCRVHADGVLQEGLSELEKILLNFDYLFYVSFFDQKQELNVHDMITLQLSEDSSLKATFEQIMETNSDKCLIMLDVVNEFTLQGSGREKISGLDESKSYTFIMSTRSRKTDFYKENDKVIEIAGTSILSPFSFVRKAVDCLNKCSKKEKDFMDFLTTFGISECQQTKPVVLMLKIRLWYDEE